MTFKILFLFYFMILVSSQIICEINDLIKFKKFDYQFDYDSQSFRQTINKIHYGIDWEISFIGFDEIGRELNGVGKIEILLSSEDESILWEQKYYKNSFHKCYLNQTFIFNCPNCFYKMNWIEQENQ